ncbi:MAG: L-2-amino-thiazoline-4-carboxylic acid hydrolase [Lachnospiraceae bacterium]|nr:L-2-amino-thiazoline-4-carboxylic acid hydrolase [Lachnospiraceae bacterium]
MEKMVYKAIIRYLKKHYPGEMGTIIKRAKEILPELKAKAPDLGGRENSLANNLDMFLLFLSFYEASDHRMSGEAIDEIIASLYDRLQFLNGILNINRPGFLKLLRKHLYRSYWAYAAKVKQKRSRGEWIETWGMIVDPKNTDVGFAFTLVGCPLAEYAKKYGYEELMPHMCALDHSYAKIIHAKLIRTHTVATGADSCDYWYVPDESDTARSYRGRII